MMAYGMFNLLFQVNLIKLENKNQYIRALAFRLYENNGVLKRNDIEDVINKINKEDRKQFRSLGIKVGRYHVFLPKMLKPKAVELRILLWKFFNEIIKNSEIPRSGLNFLIDEKVKFFIFIYTKPLTMSFLLYNMYNIC